MMKRLIPIEIPAGESVVVPVEAYRLFSAQVLSGAVAVSGTLERAANPAVEGVWSEVVALAAGEYHFQESLFAMLRFTATGATVLRLGLG